MSLPILINLIIFLLLLYLLSRTHHLQWSLSKKVFCGLVIGCLFGLGLQYVYHTSATSTMSDTIKWINVIGSGYIRLLQMIVMPLVFISILGAVAKLHNASSLGKISVFTIGTLLFTTMIAAFVGIGITLLFNLSAEGLIAGQKELSRLETINSNLLGKVSNLEVPDMLLSFIPKNPFHALADLNTTSIISVVIFAVFLGIAALKLLKEEPEKGKKIINAIECLQALVMKLVRLVMLLTPYGVMALMTKIVASSNLKEILSLGEFIVASYVALAIMFVVHGILLSIVGVNPFRFFKKIWPVLTFAFTSRSSAATIPLNIEAQRLRLGVPESIASFSASFGATIGQNGCAGIYPAMLAVMVAPSVGINPLDPIWIATLIGIVTISSAGVAGVGGGATFAALIVLPTMGLPIELVALLVSIEPLIDMGRTALNVNGSMTAGTITSQLLGQTDKSVLNAEQQLINSHS